MDLNAIKADDDLLDFLSACEVVATYGPEQVFSLRNPADAWLARTLVPVLEG